MHRLPVPLLALDPSSTYIGWCLLNCGPAGPIYLNSGTYKVPEAPPDHRVVMVGAGIEWILNQCLSTPGCHGGVRHALVEVPDFIASYARPRSIVLYMRAVGAAEHALHKLGFAIRHQHASHSNQASRKQQGKDRFLKITGRYPLTDDESDALCLGWDYLTGFLTSLQPPPVSPQPPMVDVDDEEWNYDEHGPQ